MNTEKKLADQVEVISELAKENKHIDAATIMMNALELSEKNTVSPKAKKWAYLISIAAPPLGMLCAVWYFFKTEEDAKQVEELVGVIDGYSTAAQNAQDLAIDGSIYILTKTDIKKFTAGKVATFLFPALPEAFSGTGKIYTDSKASKVYILDADGKIIITEKTGKLVRILQSDELKGANDFVVDEAAKVIYVLRNGSLLKLGL